MQCPGCHKTDTEGYCNECRKRLFDGHRVHPTLPFSAPKADNLALFQEKTKHLSISGVQLKYSVKREGKELNLTERGGQYILKPIPPSTQLIDREQAPENEHLTMQMATQLFDIHTAANGLIYFNDGTPAYLTKRFDLRTEGGKYQQEDMAQLSGRTRFTHGEDFKYSGTYEEIGRLIRNNVAAYMPALEQFFRTVVFNYLFSNGDAHLKNFSLIQTAMGDYTLAPAYDLMCTVLHTPLESDTALDLYDGSMNDPFYASFGYYGQRGFRLLADKIGIIPIRRDRIMTQLLSSTLQVEDIIRNSFLNEKAKADYLFAYKDKIFRMGMTKDMIGKVINPKYPGVYAPTENPIKLTLLDGKTLIGYFNPIANSDELEKENKYSFVEIHNSTNYRTNQDPKYITTMEGDLLTKIEYTTP
ncbi:MAG TPA: HipA domain-containing protein [Puia sp.]|jgi:serine/threonine-protein kinase HipA|nr:HipA domain-containing protein [Puia sp.]